MPSVMDAPELMEYGETHDLIIETLERPSATPSPSRILAHAGAYDHPVPDPDAASTGRVGVQRLSPVRDPHRPAGTRVSIPRCLCPCHHL